MERNKTRMSVSESSFFYIHMRPLDHDANRKQSLAWHSQGLKLSLPDALTATRLVELTTVTKIL